VPFVGVHESGSDAVDGSSTGTRVPKMWVLLKAPTIRRSQVMQTVSTIGLDIAKSVFQVHGVDNDGKVAHRAISDSCLGWSLSGRSGHPTTSILDRLCLICFAASAATRW
jgi:hypothetical protein